MSILTPVAQLPNIAPMRYQILRVLLIAVIIALGLEACDEGSNQATWYSHNTLYYYSGTQGNLWDHMRNNLHMPTYTYTGPVRRQIIWYQHHQAYLNHIIVESAPYIYYIYQQTQKRHLPAELALIPIIESEYNPYARSRTGAMGLWQMMPGTARGFGLKRDWWYDGRKDVVTSTNAALEYFAYLHDFFNRNWLLAIAAYDCGEGTVMQCVHYNRYHHLNTDFWNLPLPEETRYYVPRLLAVAAIVKAPWRYHIRLEPINDAPYVEPVNVGSQIALSKAAQMADVPLSTMKALNPGIQHGRTDPRGPYTLLVPQEKADTLKVKLGLITEDEQQIWQKHIVQSKETLAKIAQKYQTTLVALREANGLKSDVLHPNQTLLVPPAKSSETQPTLAENDKTTTTTAAVTTATAKTLTTAIVTTENSANATATTVETPLPVTYKVAEGDNLHTLAKRFHTSVSKIRTTNNLASYTLQVGQTLTIPSRENNATGKVAAEDTGSVKSSHKITYVVREGDYIEKIAEHFNIKTKDLKKWNQLSENDILRPGQKLIINKTSLE